MTPERYRRINELADAALELPAARRDAFLADACAGDEELRADVERLVRTEESGVDFLTAPAISRLAGEFVQSERNEDLTGRRFGRYEVVSRLGAGGHGEVWLAQDRQLSRPVAIKLLSPAYASRPDHVERLYAEARISSSLNHPNIVTIYDTGHVDGADFIAQEYVAGETLRRRLRAGPLDLRTSLRVVLEIASALEAAHVAGVVHRDIKPENVMIRADGLVKVLDFGLARSLRDTPRDSRTGGSSVVMGTVKYMSPEQVRGEDTDARSDIFSLGILLYETLSGEAPFGGTTYTEIVTAILQSEPSLLSTHVRGLPADVERILARCLAKSADRRYQSGAELRQDLLRLAQRIDAGPLRKRRHWIVGLTACAGILAGFGIYRGVMQSRPAPFDSMKLSLLPTSGLAADAAISPDGKSVAYVLEGARGKSIWLRRLGTSGDRQILAPVAENRWRLTFSTSGAEVYYRQGNADWTGDLYRLPIAGGAPVRVVQNIAGSVAFSHDGRRVAFIRLYTGRWEASLIVANADGGAERVVTTRRRPQYYSMSGLAWSPDDRSIVCLGGNSPFYGQHAFQLVEIPVDGGKERAITAGGWASPGSILWTADGRSLIVDGGRAEDSGQVWRVSYPDGQIQRITNDLGDYLKLTQTADSKTLLAVRREQTADLWLTPGSGEGQAVQIPTSDLHKLASAIWVSGEQIVFSALAGNARNIWTMDAQGGNRKQLTTGESDQTEIAVSRDGRYLAYLSEGHIWRVNVDGSGARQLTHGALDVHPAFSPDGRWVVYASFSGWSPGIGGQPMLWKIPVDGGAAVNQTMDNTSVPDVSPDGELIACAFYRYDRPDQSPAIAIYPFSGGTLSKHFDRPPGANDRVYWTADGAAIDYVVTTGGVSNVWRQPLDGSPPAPITGFRTGRIFFSALSPDRKMLMLGRGQEANDLVLLSDIQ